MPSGARLCPKPTPFDPAREGRSPEDPDPSDHDPSRTGPSPRPHRLAPALHAPDFRHAGPPRSIRNGAGHTEARCPAPHAPPRERGPGASARPNLSFCLSDYTLAPIVHLARFPNHPKPGWELCWHDKRSREGVRHECNCTAPECHSALIALARKAPCRPPSGLTPRQDLRKKRPLRPALSETSPGNMASTGLRRKAQQGTQACRKSHW